MGFRIISIDLPKELKLIVLTVDTILPVRFVVLQGRSQEFQSVGSQYLGLNFFRGFTGGSLSYSLKIRGFPGPHADYAPVLQY